MHSQFRTRESIAQDQMEWGRSRWLSHPASTGASQIAALDADLAPGKGHDFHVHPGQEEVLCVIDGEVEQWIEREKRLLRAGDAIFVAPGTVHATFNVGKSDARLVVFFSPCVGQGFEAVDVSGRAPWQGLRA